MESTTNHNGVVGLSPNEIVVPEAYGKRMNCKTCSISLPLRLSRPGEEAALWRCTQCESPFVAVCRVPDLASMSARIYLDKRYFDIGASETPSQLQQAAEDALQEIAAGLAHDYRRRSVRVGQSLVVPAVTMSAHGSPVGDPYPIVVANLSKEGVGLVNRKPIETDQFAMLLPFPDGRHLQVMAQVRRENSLHCGWLEVGAEFTARLGKPMAF